MTVMRYKFSEEDMEPSYDGLWVSFHDYQKLEEALEHIINADSSAAQVIALRALGKPRCDAAILTRVGKQP